MDTYSYLLDGTKVKTTAEGRIYWSDSWERMDELEQKGYLRHEHYGPETYGHVDYFVNAMAMLGAIIPRRQGFGHLTTIISERVEHLSPPEAYAQGVLDTLVRK